MYILDGIRLGISPPVYSYDEFLDGIFDIGDAISDFFTNTGKYCVEWINGAVGAYHKLTSSVSEILQTDINSGMFSDFWKVLNSISSVICIIASTLIVLFFLTNLCSEAWETRHEMDIWGLTKDLVKLVVSVVVVNNAMLLTKLIFSAGAKLAMLVTLTNSDLASAIELPEETAGYLVHGVTGFRGLFIFVMYLIAALIIVVCAGLVTFEVYKRLFRIYILIPFSTLSFSTFVIGSHQHGNEVFYGYVKNIVQTALEGLVIMLLLFFSYSLISNNATMSALFPTHDKYDAVTGVLNTPTDASVLCIYLTEYSKNDAGNNMSFSEYMKSYCDERNEQVSAHMLSYIGTNAFSYSDISKDLLVTLDEMDDVDSSSYLVYSVRGIESGGTAALEGIRMLSRMDDVTLHDVSYAIYPSCSILDALMIMLQVLFPCSLCAGCVKAASNWSGMILGK